MAEETKTVRQFLSENASAPAAPSALALFKEAATT
jgi:hypothetical protein